MHIQHHEDRAGSEACIMPGDIDPDCTRILIEAGFEWDSHSLAFRRKTQAGEATIEYRFLREQKLILNSSLDRNERTGQLQRLRILLQSMD